MKNVITKISVTEGISLVTVAGIANDNTIIADVLGAIAKDGITLDMIGLSPLVKGSDVTLSFSLDDRDLGKVITVIGNFKKVNPDMRTEVNNGNTKICIYGEAMPQTPGVAADLMSALVKSRIDVRLITTSDTDISMLVSEGDTDKAVEAVKAEFGI